MWFPSSRPTDHPPLFEFRDVVNTDAPAVAALPPAHCPAVSIPAAATTILVLPVDDLPIPTIPPTAVALFPPSLFRKIDSFLFLTVLPALFDLPGTSCKLISLNHSLLPPIAPPTVAILATSLDIILTILHFLTQLVAGGFYRIASLLPLLTTSNLGVTASFSAQLLLPTPLLISPGLMLSHSSTSVHLPPWTIVFH